MKESKLKRTKFQKSSDIKYTLGIVYYLHSLSLQWNGSKIFSSTVDCPHVDQPSEPKCREGRLQTFASDILTSGHLNLNIVERLQTFASHNSPVGWNLCVVFKDHCQLTLLSHMVKYFRQHLRSNVQNINTSGCHASFQLRTRPWFCWATITLWVDI